MVADDGFDASIAATSEVKPATSGALSATKTRCTC